MCSEENCEKVYRMCETVTELKRKMIQYVTGKTLYDPLYEFCDPLNGEHIQCADEQEQLACMEIKKTTASKTRRRIAEQALWSVGPIGFEFANCNLAHAEN